MSIISFDRTNARNRSCSPRRCRARLWCNYYRASAMIIERPPPRSIARHYLSIAVIIYRSSAMIIERPPPRSIARHYLSIARHYLSIARHPDRSSATQIDRSATPIEPATY
ncbi:MULTISPECIES: hypothetical protein [unclassified Microcoleus]|uniref:hypothetical protein n=1 Tax=unclassified Microcoleus TaxID=2642155 RepID=UPI002FD3D232